MQDRRSGHCIEQIARYVLSVGVMVAGGVLELEIG
jgi:hypothetical protein